MAQLVSIYLLTIKTTKKGSKFKYNTFSYQKEKNLSQISRQLKSFPQGPNGKTFETTATVIA